MNLSSDPINTLENLIAKNKTKRISYLSSGGFGYFVSNKNLLHTRLN